MITNKEIRTLVNDALLEKNIPCWVDYDGFPVHKAGSPSKPIWYVKIKSEFGICDRIFFDESDSNNNMKAAVIEEVNKKMAALI